MNVWLKEIDIKDGQEYLDLLMELASYKDVYAKPVPEDFSQDEYETFKVSRIRMKLNDNLPKGVVPTSTYWVMEGDKPIGYATLKHHINFSQIGGHTGCCLKKSCQNRGFGLIVSELLSKIAYNDLGINELVYTAKNENLQSQRSLEKIGATFVSEYNGYKFYVVDLVKKYANEERRNK